MRHILALSGGKDSAALAVYMREKHPDLELEYVFTDSGCELPETYEYLDRIEAVLGIKITVIKPEKSWEYWLRVKSKRTPAGTFPYLPSPKKRWCTEVLKLKPYQNWLEAKYPGYIIHNYVGLRADESRERKGLISAEKIITHFPFVEANMVYEDIKNILEYSGLGFPGYYSWRKRSGCYFCFYQSKSEWIGLHDHHPELFFKAMSYETIIPHLNIRYTWCEGISLSELIQQREKFLVDNEEQNESKHQKKLIDVLGNSFCDMEMKVMG